MLPQPDFFECTAGEFGADNLYGYARHVDGSITYVQTWYDPETGDSWRTVWHFDPNDQIGCYDVRLADLFGVDAPDVLAPWQEYRANCMLGDAHFDWANSPNELRHGGQLYDMLAGIEEDCRRERVIIAEPPPSTQQD